MEDFVRLWCMVGKRRHWSEPVPSVQDQRCSLLFDLGFDGGKVMMFSTLPAGHKEKDRCFFP